MSTKIKNIFFILFWWFIVFLCLFHSRLFWIEEIIVSWNYEFTKVSIFNIIFPFLFIINYLLFFRNIHLDKKVWFSILVFYFILCVSTYLGEVQNQSIFWWNSKWHWFFYWNNLILIFLFFYFWIQKFGKKWFEKIFLFWWVWLLLYWFKELIFPSFEYWVLGTRMLSSLWHPNYLAAYFVLLIPYIFFKERHYCKKNNKLWKYLYFILFILFSTWIFLTKSAIAIALLILFLLLQIGKKISLYSKLFIGFLTILLGWIWLFIIAPEKFSSFISRYFIWETSIKILLSDLKIFIFGIWNENLWYFFNNFKSPELYLYERYGYFATRWHNIFIDFWLHFWILWLIFFSTLIYKIIQNFHSQKYYYFSLLWVIIFWLFHFPNIIWSIFFLFLLAVFLIEKKKTEIVISTRILYIFIFIFSVIWCIWSYFSYNFYQAEIQSRKWNLVQAQELFPYFSLYYYKNLQMGDGLKAENNFKSEKYLQYELYYATNTISSCNDLVEKYPTVENFFLCGKRIEKKYDFETAKKYYQMWLEKFPDIFTRNNQYLHNFPWKYIINTNHVLHEKFSDIQEIIKKLKE